MSVVLLTALRFGPLLGVANCLPGPSCIAIWSSVASGALARYRSSANAIVASNSNTGFGSVARSFGTCSSRLIRYAVYLRGNGSPPGSIGGAGCGSRLASTTARYPSSSPRASSVSLRSTLRTWASRSSSSWQGKTFSMTSCVTSRYFPVATSASGPRSTPPDTHCDTSTSGLSIPSPSARTTRASQGGAVCGGSAGFGLRSHGRVRRLSTICGSRSRQSPSEPAGGNVDRI